MTMFNGIIYKYTSPSGKVYIGQTVDEKKRRKDFLSANNPYAGDKINKARKKYGPENFEYEILTTVSADSVESLCDLLDFSEQYYIEKYDSCNSGYNLLEGGASFRNWKKTQEQVEKQRISLINYYKIHENPNSKKVLQYDLDGNFIKEWNSASEAERNLGYSIGNISGVCCGRGQTALGYMWKYKESEEIPLKIEASKSKGTTKKHTGVLQLDLDGNLIREWKTTVEACTKLNIKCKSAISEVCRGKRKTAAGYVWRYKEQVNLISENKYEI